MNFKYCLGLASLVYFAVLFGCVNPPEYPIEPDLEYISLSKDTMRRGTNTDTTYINFSFTDGDGDIGNRDTLDLFVIDDREGTVLPNRIPFVPELGASNGIKGEITLLLKSTCCVFPDSFINGCNEEMPSYPYDVVNYSIFLVDRKGHNSDTIKVEPIYIQCFN